ncbi:hypothetical protein D9611_014551 [Ephemerocybe angulata]|uniref:SH3 domain-containing protein n=1 Tax=Ephemerocybe angulata TaxID=980116 RepID=A0A8H5CCB2_9AGAR|nr:hypothetical protein D9611_014551 [Tulosesus angulatus]
MSDSYADEAHSNDDGDVERRPTTSTTVDLVSSRIPASRRVLRISCPGHAALNDSAEVAHNHGESEYRGACTALHTFEATEQGELVFEKDDIIKVVDRGYKDWWRGRHLPRQLCVRSGDDLRMMEESLARHTRVYEQSPNEDRSIPSINLIVQTPVLQHSASFTSQSALILHLEGGWCSSGINRTLVNKAMHKKDVNNLITDPSRNEAGVGVRHETDDEDEDTSPNNPQNRREIWETPNT